MFWLKYIMTSFKLNLLASEANHQLSFWLCTYVFMMNTVCTRPNESLILLYIS